MSQTIKHNTDSLDWKNGYYRAMEYACYLLGYSQPKENGRENVLKHLEELTNATEWRKNESNS